MYLLFIQYSVGHNDFDAGKSILRAIWNSWTLKIETFLGPEMAMREGSAMWAPKSSRFSGPNYSNGPE